jgi:hypothetical protein
MKWTVPVVVVSMIVGGPAYAANPTLADGHLSHPGMGWNPDGEAGAGPCVSSGNEAATSHPKCEPAAYTEAPQDDYIARLRSWCESRDLAEQQISFCSKNGFMKEDDTRPPVQRDDLASALCQRRAGKVVVAAPCRREIGPLTEVD